MVRSLISRIQVKRSRFDINGVHNKQVRFNVEFQNMKSWSKLFSEAAQDDRIGRIIRYRNLHVSEESE